MNGTSQKLSSGTWSTANLRSTADSSSSACQARFLSGATLPATTPALGTSPADVNTSATCFGLSAQVSLSSNQSLNTSGSGFNTTLSKTSVNTVSNATVGFSTVNTSLSGTPTPTPTPGPVTAKETSSGSAGNLGGQTIQMFTSFTPKVGAALTPVYIGSCSYNTDGSPALKTMTMQGTGQPTLSSLTTGTSGSGGGGASAPYITDLTFDTTNPNQFYLSVAYSGPQYPTVNFNQFTVNFPSSNPYATVSSTLSMNSLSTTAAAGKTAAATTSSAKTTSSFSTAGSMSATTISTGPQAPCSGTLGSNYACRLPQQNEVLKIGPFPISAIGDALCTKSLVVNATTSVLYPSTVPAAMKLQINKSFTKTVTDTPCPPPTPTPVPTPTPTPVPCDSNATPVIQGTGITLLGGTGNSAEYTATFKNTSATACGKAGTFTLSNFSEGYPTTLPAYGASGSISFQVTAATSGVNCSTVHGNQQATIGFTLTDMPGTYSATVTVPCP